jgi:hypothetical protein
VKEVPSEISLILEIKATDALMAGEVPASSDPFRFEFEVPFHAGKSIDIGQTIEAAGIPVTLEQITVSHWGARAVFQLPNGDRYSLIVSLTLPNDDSVNGVLSKHMEASIVQYFTGDFTGQSGEWKVTIKELVYSPESPTAGTHPASDTKRLAGPWEFKVQFN